MEGAKPREFVQSPRRSPTEPTGFVKSVGRLEVPQWTTGCPSSRTSPLPLPGQEHEVLMQEFVHAHLMTILQPFSEQLQTLQEELQQLAVQIPPVAQEVVQNREKIAQLATTVPPLEQADVALAQKIEEVRLEVRAIVPKHEKLAADHEELKGHLMEADGRLLRTSEQIEALMGGQDGVMAQLQRLHEGLSEVEKHVSTVVESRLNYLHTFCKDLRGEQTTQLETISQLDENCCKNGDAIKQVRMRVSARQAEDDEKFACLSQHAKGFEAKLSQFLPEVKTNEDAIKQHDKELQRLMGDIQKLRSMQQLYAEYSEIFISVRENTRRVAKVEDTVQVLSARNPVEVHHFQETIQRLQNQMDENETRLQSVDRSQLGLSGRIEQVARSIEPFEPEIKSLERRCGMIDAEVQGLALWQHGSTEKFEEHSLKFQQQKSDLQKLQAEIDARGGYLEEIQSELATQQRKIVRIDGNVDVMQKYFTGLGKGLQDTTRSVSARDMATPRATPPRPQSATTPATGLPTLCGSGSPRRRPWSSKEVRTRGDLAEC
ncbi:Uncharacterized protein SCF082_LOCUS43773 [Durusdinium trenchii]|uniref:Uncharacterized protein n=1 Tax=Durusdinium trenchii TaxID=1381693 RepID=A0ABP0QX79_9DINO